MLPWVIPRPHRDGGSLYCFLGWRIGKGEGYADLEYAMMVSMGAVSQGTPVVTIVHDCQVLPVNGWQSHWHTPLRGRRGGRCGERGRQTSAFTPHGVTSGFVEWHGREASPRWVWV